MDDTKTICIVLWREGPLLKILFINALYSPNQVGGAERVIQSLAEGLVRAGHQVVVISAAPHKGTRIGYVNGVKVYYVGRKDLYFVSQRVAEKLIRYIPSNRRFKQVLESKEPCTEDQGGSILAQIAVGKRPAVLRALAHVLETHNPWMARETARILDAECPDLVNTSTLPKFSTSVFRVVKQRGLPLIHTPQDYYLLCPRSSMFRKGKNCQRRCAQCYPYALPREHFSNQVDVVVGPSRFTLERHLNFGYFAATPKKRVIYNAHRIEVGTPVRDTPTVPIRFGFLGRLIPDKGLEVLLKSVMKLPKRAWSLNIGGRGASLYESYLNNKYSTSAITFLGSVKPEVFFSKIDVLVVPSLWHDPSPRVINEAYAFGVPVIGSDRGGIPELVEDGSTGFVFNPDRPEDLTAKMRRFISDPTIIDGMRAACLAKAETFLPDNIIEQYLEVYAEATKAEQ